MKYKVLRTDTADALIRNIVLYIAEKFGNETALEKLNDLEASILALGDNPYIVLFFPKCHLHLGHVSRGQRADETAERLHALHRDVPATDCRSHRALLRHRRPNPRPRVALRRPSAGFLPIRPRSLHLLIKRIWIR